MTSVTDTSISVPLWFERFYDSVYFWTAVGAGSLLIAVSVILVCRLWYETKEAQRFLADKEDAEREKEELSI
ncbi:hypothetical protein [Parabacteroides sp.]